MIERYKWALAVTAVSLAVGVIAIYIIGPETQIAVHWDSTGNADRIDNAWFGLMVIPVIQILTILLFGALKYIEPRVKNLEKSGKALQAIVLAITAFLLLVQLLIAAQGYGYQLAHLNIIFAGIGLMLAVMGNYFGKLRSSFFIGIRTPWTLSSETIWKKTHRLGGKLFVLAGVILILASLIQKETQLAVTMIFVIVPAALIPAAYSWLLWRKEQAD